MFYTGSTLYSKEAGLETCTAIVACGFEQSMLSPFVSLPVSCLEADSWAT